MFKNIQGIKRHILVTVTTGLVMWVIAGIWHNLIMANLYNDVHAKHEGIGLLLIAYFILAAIMSYLYPKYSGENNSLVKGLSFGIIIGILWVFPHGLAMAGAHNSSILYVLKNSLWHTVEQGIGGVVISLFYLNTKR